MEGVGKIPLADITLIEDPTEEGDRPDDPGYFPHQIIANFEPANIIFQILPRQAVVAPWVMIWAVKAMRVFLKWSIDP